LKTPVQGRIAVDLSQNRVWTRQRVSRRLALSCCSVALAGILIPTSGYAQTITNPVSAFDITVDGQFTGGVSNGQLVGEWSDITPAAFISPPTDAGSLVATTVGDPRANSLLYAGLDPGKDNLYLMYDYLPRTNPVFQNGDVAGQISFPVTLPAGGVFGTGGKTDITVKLVFGSPAGVHGDAQFNLSAHSFTPLQVVVDGTANGTNQPFEVPAASLGMEAALGFGPSTLSTTPHMLIELSVPLLIPADFGSAFPTSGESGPDNSGYSPDPAFWGGNFANNGGDPPGSAAMFQILPNGNTLITPLAPSVPEPSALALGAAGLAFGLLAARRKRRRGGTNDKDGDYRTDPTF
jgi:hypothetical protein